MPKLPFQMKIGDVKVWRSCFGVLVSALGPRSLANNSCHLTKVLYTTILSDYRKYFQFEKMGRDSTSSDITTLTNS